MNSRFGRFASDETASSSALSFNISRGSVIVVSESRSRQGWKFFFVVSPFFRDEDSQDLEDAMSKISSLKLVSLLWRNADEERCDAVVVATCDLVLFFDNLESKHVEIMLLKIPLDLPHLRRKMRTVFLKIGDDVGRRKQRAFDPTGSPLLLTAVASSSTTKGWFKTLSCLVSEQASALQRSTWPMKT